MYIKVNSSGYIPSSKMCSNGSHIVGGSIPLLLNKIIRNPSIKGGSITLGSNKPVGIITGPVQKYGGSVILDKPKGNGGELLNSLSGVSFNKNTKSNKRDNVKFVF